MISIYYIIFSFLLLVQIIFFSLGKMWWTLSTIPHFTIVELSMKLNWKLTFMIFLSAKSLISHFSCISVAIPVCVCACVSLLSVVYALISCCVLCCTSTHTLSCQIVTFSRANPHCFLFLVEIFKNITALMSASCTMSSYITVFQLFSESSELEIYSLCYFQ